MTLAVLAVCALSSPAVTTLSGDAWEFATPGEAWAQVRVPHDWAIAGPFKPAEKGWQGKLPWKGEGRYRRVFDLTDGQKARLAAGGRAYLEFDGAMASPRVRLNGSDLGGVEYGYMSFALDATAAVRGTSNLLEVACSTKRHSSRWYPGAGLYRDVRLKVVPKKHVLPGTMRITTDVEADARFAKVAVRYVSSTEGERSFSVDVPNPRLWSLEDPHLYTLEAEGETFRYGIRTFRFDPDKGFFLNGRRVQLKGVCLHSDLGPLGMAYDHDAMKRQLLLMKDMGVNALRTSHNCPCPDLLDLCDEMGVFVWDECFDNWSVGATGRGKDAVLEDYVEDNLRRFVRRDRNHPSVFVWSIGNELPGWSDADDWHRCGMRRDRFERFRAAIREEDATRPVGIACCHLDTLENLPGLYEPLDVVGWNYGEKYVAFRAKYPRTSVLYTESASALSEYGFYELPVAADKKGYSRDVLRVGSYDHCAAPWSDIADHEFARMARDAYCGGDFVWTGIDYLGEPTPIANDSNFGISTNEELLARSSYFGAADLCGIPKDRFWLYRSYWNTARETVHVVPRAAGLRVHVGRFGGTVPERTLPRDAAQGRRTRARPRLHERLLRRLRKLPPEVVRRPLGAGRTEGGRAPGRKGRGREGPAHGGPGREAAALGRPLQCAGGEDALRARRGGGRRRDALPACVDARRVRDFGSRRDRLGGERQSKGVRFVQGRRVASPPLRHLRCRRPAHRNGPSRPHGVRRGTCFGRL